MKLTMLGTGNAKVTECYNTCFLLNDENGYFLVDGGGGNGILKQLKSAGVSWEDIHDIDLIMLKEGSFIRNMILQKLKDNNIKPNIVLESNQIETIKGLISSNVGMAFLLDFIVQDTPHIKTLPLEEPILVDVGLAWKKDRYISKAAQSFINFCQETLNK